jgi:hypothetical protein
MAAAAEQNRLALRERERERRAGVGAAPAPGRVVVLDAPPTPRGDGPAASLSEFEAEMAAFISDKPLRETEAAVRAATARAAHCASR